jgi:hypothetical protein
MFSAFRLLGFVVLESKTELQPYRRDLSMSKDMRDAPRANLGFAANMFHHV